MYSVSYLQGLPEIKLLPAVGLLETMSKVGTAYPGLDILVPGCTGLLLPWVTHDAHQRNLMWVAPMDPPSTYRGDC